MKTKDMNGDISLFLRHEVGYMASNESESNQSLEKSIDGYRFWISEALTPKLSVVITTDMNLEFLSEPNIISKFNTQKYEWVYHENVENS